ncbi:hypothetical protein ACFW9F_01855 [Streptomyces sp. NPDC059506]|uniref:hypothetical protein n=1 Tax=Streptomyces sp. NPDC059506 TaxID=3347751 RepID=UPI0036B49AEA
MPDQVDNTAERLVQMRAAARHGHSIDKRDHDDLARPARRAGDLRAQAAGHCTRAGEARAEQALRATIAHRFPELHAREETGRRTVRQTRQTTQHQQATARPQLQQPRGQGLK